MRLIGVRYSEEMHPPRHTINYLVLRPLDLTCVLSYLRVIMHGSDSSIEVLGKLAGFVLWKSENVSTKSGVSQIRCHELTVAAALSHTHGMLLI